MRCVDILHKQVTHIIVLLIEHMKTGLTQQKESQVSIQKKRMFILQSAMKVVSWVNEFNPQNVNDNDLKLPEELK
jgi:hypothetical protein